MTRPEQVPTPLLSERLLWGLCLLAAAAALATTVGLAAVRIPYPFELEWMEGAMVDHAARVAAGQPIFAAPTTEHVPFLYAPLLFWLGGLGIGCGLDGLLALRLVAAASSLGVAMLVGHWVRVESGRLVPGLVASGVFLGGYGWLWWWYDLARNDSPFLLAILGTAYALRHGGRFGWLVAAVLATVAVLAKQSAAMWLPAIGTGALILDWRLAVRWGMAALLGIGVALGTMHVESDGWSTFFLFEMPRHHGIEGSRKLGFWTEDVLPMLPLLVLGVAGFVARCRAGRERPALFLAAVGSGGLVTSWLSRLHVGGFDNVMVYGFAAACLLGPLAAAGLRLVGPALLAVQFVVLGGLAIAHAPSRTALPNEAHRRAHTELAQYVAAQPGDVLIPAHGAISARAGKRPGAHGQAIFDLLQVLPKLPDGMLDVGVLMDPVRLGALPGKAPQALASFRDSVVAALQGQHYAAIVLDQQIGASFELLFAIGLAGPDGRPGTDDDLYRRRAEPLLTAPAALCPLVGYEVHSPYALGARRRP